MSAGAAAAANQHEEDKKKKQAANIAAINAADSAHGNLSMLTAKNVKQLRVKYNLSTEEWDGNCATMMVNILEDQTVEERAFFGFGELRRVSKTVKRRVSVPVALQLLLPKDAHVFSIAIDWYHQQLRIYYSSDIET